MEIIAFSLLVLWVVGMPLFLRWITWKSFNRLESMGVFDAWMKIFSDFRQRITQYFQKDRGRSWAFVICGLWWVIPFMFANATRFSQSSNDVKWMKIIMVFYQVGIWPEKIVWDILRYWGPAKDFIFWIIFGFLLSFFAWGYVGLAIYEGIKWLRRRVA